MSYQVEKELSVPRHLLAVPIKPALLRAFGLNLLSPPEDIKLAQIALQCGKYEGRWFIKACGLTGIPGQLVEVGVIRCSEDIEREGVLATADKWIREDDATIFVPGRPIEIPPTDETISNTTIFGITLVRTNGL